MSVFCVWSREIDCSQTIHWFYALAQISHNSLLITHHSLLFTYLTSLMFP
jgi:hypothetical protein